METWYTAMDLIGISGLPKTPQGINKRARSEEWEKRQKKGSNGISFEYKFSSLPKSIQAEILLKRSQPSSPDKTQADQIMSESAWNVFASATFEQEQKAERRLQAVKRVKSLVELKMPLMQALQQVVAYYAEQAETGETVSLGSLKRWWYKVRNHRQSDWLPLLLDRLERDNSQRYADICDKAWAFFLQDYLRESCPQFAACYYRLSLAAEQNGWNIPTLATLRRKLNREFTPVEIALKRGGEHALREMTAPQIRTVAHLEALEIVNGDGYQHNVFVDWYEDGSEPIRPKTWFWQDVRTRRILAYCVDATENGDQIRQATLRLIRQYGIPKTILMDNTRAASDKQTTQKTKRGKRKNDGVVIDGMLDRLGINVIRTLVFKGRGNGRAKPIERAFRRDALPQYIDLDERLNGYFTGFSPTEKPENYQSKLGVNKDLFLQVVEQGVRAWNAKPNRDTELGAGIFSADELWQRDYSQTAQTFATEEQLRQLMMLGESTKVDKYGRFTLKAGYRLHNQNNIYEAPALCGMASGSVIVRYDPDNLHGTVYVYDQNGVYLCDADCVQKTAFDSEQGAREQRRLERKNARIAKQMVQNHEQLAAHEMEQYRKHLAAPDADFVKPAFIQQLVQEGSALRKVQPVESLLDDDESEFEQGWQKGLQMMKKEKGL